MSVCAVIVLTVSRDGQIEASFSADYADQIALAMWLHVYNKLQEEGRIKGPWGYVVLDLDGFAP